ncbi:hypothetical protein HO173_004043 [Letharia columbiana]|uniref:Mitochondrial ribosomal protein L27 n=1 Tax=Letharia columbiana TaxID=112416 RepID=A0A8H6FZP7_9LECA|nr:uncharacterized protein HO173_004043 [Letharia columbiana]KAF6237842.1 hypothetical protein HO173_004043 [Letharia columbiana]
MKPTAALCSRVRRLPLTTKQVSNGFYKGTGTGATGRHTKHGGYVIEWRKVRTYVVPEQLKDCKLTPFVTRKMRPSKGRFEGEFKGPLSGEAYLKRWKEENGTD